MTKSVLFVCKSCTAETEQENTEQPSDGAKLLSQLQSLQDGACAPNLEVRSIGCLWTCSHPCAVAFAAPDKATYLFTDVPATAAEALLQFGERYGNSAHGAIAWKQFPEPLQSVSIAKIPSAIFPEAAEIDE